MDRGVKMMKRVLIEACCGSADDVAEAFRGGADRVELNSCLFMGGLTPTVGTLVVAREQVSIPIMTMVRPRSGGFCYTDLEYSAMLKDGEELLRHGADGLVFGCLTPGGKIDEQRTKALVELCGEKDAVFHRAFDVTPDWKQALDTLIRLGVKRVLTSGQEKNAFFGLETLAEMIAYAGDAIEILPGAGINLNNVNRVVRETGCTQVHFSRHRTVSDTSTCCNGEITFGGALYPPESSYQVTDGDYYAAVRARLDE